MKHIPPAAGSSKDPHDACSPSLTALPLSERAACPEAQLTALLTAGNNTVLRPIHNPETLWPIPAS